jgi:hypothetical protein
VGLETTRLKELVWMTAASAMKCYLFVKYSAEGRRNGFGYMMCLGRLEDLKGKLLLFVCVHIRVANGVVFFLCGWRTFAHLFENGIRLMYHDLEKITLNL